MRAISEDPRSIGQMLQDLRNDVTFLLRQEVELIKTEATQKTKQVAKDSAYLVAGGVLGLFALMILCQTLCVVLAVLLSLVMDWRIAAWLGPLIGAVLLGVAGYALVRVGQRRLQREDLAPEHTLESLQEGKQWLQEKVS